MYSSSISGSGFSIYDLIDQYMKIEERPRDELIAKRTDLTSRKSIFSTLDSKLSALRTKLEYLTDEISNPFLAKSGVSSDPDKVGVTTTSSAVTGNHTITVERLAKADTRVSNKYQNSDSSFTSFTSDQSFYIEVAHPTDSDPDNRVQIQVTVEASVFSGTNDDVLVAIRDAVNDAMAQAVIDETIDADEVVNATVMHEQSDTSRLSFSSEQTGYTYRMDFGSSTLLDFLGINATTAATDSDGGYITPVGTGATDSELNSKFYMDGLTFYRDSNNVEEAVDGVTLKLYDTFTSPETITIASDKEAVKADVEEFISLYNEAVDYLRAQTKVDPDTHERGPLSTDITYRGILSDLRSIISSEVDTVSNSEYSILYDIGIEADTEGKLSIVDSSKFEAALEANPQNVADIFRSSNGIAVQLDDYITNFVETGGIIDSSKAQIDRQITNINDRISYMNVLLDKKEKQYFEEFTKLQETMAKLQSQQAFFNSFYGSGGGSSLF